jgi:dynein heavy chain
MLVVNGTDGINFQPPVGDDASKIGMKDMIDNVIGSFFQISTLFNRLNTDGTYLGEMHSDLAINSVLALLSDAIFTKDKKCHDLKKNFNIYSIFGRPTSAHTLRTFARLLDLDKFDMATQKYFEAQADVAKAQSPCDIGWLRIDITPAKRDVSLFATK